MLGAVSFLHHPGAAAGWLRMLGAVSFHIMLLLALQRLVTVTVAAAARGR
jgi:hypothetical protein